MFDVSIKHPDFCLQPPFQQQAPPSFQTDRQTGRCGVAMVSMRADVIERLIDPESCGGDAMSNRVLPPL